MNNYDKKIAVEQFIKNVSYDLSEVKRLVSFLKIEDEKERKALEEAIKIYENKIKKLRKVHSLEEASKYIKVKKAIKNSIEDKRIPPEDI